MRVVPPPSSVTTPPPSTVVFIPLGGASAEVSVIVAGPPQSNVTTPPAFTAAASVASLHARTTVVGFDVSAAPNGNVHARLAGIAGASIKAASWVPAPAASPEVAPELAPAPEL